MKVDLIVVMYCVGDYIVVIKKGENRGCIVVYLNVVDEFMKLKSYNGELIFYVIFLVNFIKENVDLCVIFL